MKPGDPIDDLQKNKTLLKEVASTLAWIAEAQKLRSHPQSDDLAGSFDKWFDGGALKYGTAGSTYYFSNGITASVLSLIPGLSILIKFPNDEQVSIEQRMKALLGNTMSESPAPGESSNFVARCRARFLFCETSVEALSATLETFGALPQPERVWVYPTVSEQLLQFHLIDDLPGYENDLSADALLNWWLPLKSALAKEVTLALCVNAGEGQLAEQELRKFALSILAAHEGVAQDDHRDQAWKLEEIQSGKVMKFFAG